METIKKLRIGTRVTVVAGRRYVGKSGWIAAHNKPELKATHYAINLHPANLSSGTVVYIGHHQVEEVPAQV